jgi:hypothetical protein
MKSWRIAMKPASFSPKLTPLATRRASPSSTSFAGIGSQRTAASSLPSLKLEGPGRPICYVEVKNAGEHTMTTPDRIDEGGLDQ